MPSGSPQRIDELRSLIGMLPEENRTLLSCLNALFFAIAQRAATNKMNATNLATVIGPTLLYARLDASSTSLLGNMNAANLAIEAIISCHNQIFGLPEQMRGDNEPETGAKSSEAASQPEEEKRQEASRHAVPLATDIKTEANPIAQEEVKETSVPLPNKGTRPVSTLILPLGDREGLNETAVTRLRSVRDQWRQRESNSSGELPSPRPRVLSSD